MSRSLLFAAAALLLLAGAPPAHAQGLVPASKKMPLDTLIRLGRPDLDEFWARAVNGYRAPGALYAYAAPVPTPCGAAAMGNAFYCGADHNIYYDVNLLRTIHADPRAADFGALAILAHEWAHAVQVQLPAGYTSPLTMTRELQADCFAGSYAKYLDARSSSRLMLDPGDLEEGANTLFSMGDDLPWFHREAHGTPDQRNLHFTIGVKEGLEACFPDEIYKDGNYFIVRPRPWRVQNDGRWLDRSTYVSTVLLTPPRAERAELHGYLSEGIRVRLYLPVRGSTWSTLQQLSFTNGVVARVIKANPTFRVTDSTSGVWASLGGKLYRFVGNDARVSESERTSYVVASDQRLVLIAELTSPASRYDYYQRRLEQVFATLHFLRPQAP